MALAQGLGSASRHQGLVVLADLALHADLALLHDAGDVVPGRPGAGRGAPHRDARPSTRCGPFAFAVDGRGYDLVLGLRRHRDWPVLRPRAVQAAHRQPAAQLPAGRGRRRRRSRGRRRGRLGRRRGAQRAGPIDRRRAPTSCWSSRHRRVIGHPPAGAAPSTSCIGRASRVDRLLPVVTRSATPGPGPRRDRRRHRRARRRARPDLAAAMPSPVFVRRPSRARRPAPGRGAAAPAAGRAGDRRVSRPCSTARPLRAGRTRRGGPMPVAAGSSVRGPTTRALGAMTGSAARPAGSEWPRVSGPGSWPGASRGRRGALPWRPRWP